MELTLQNFSSSWHAYSVEEFLSPSRVVLCRRGTQEGPLVETAPRDGNHYIFACKFQKDPPLSSISCDKTPCSPFKVDRRFGGTILHLQGRRVALLLFFAFYWTLKMEATYFSETLVEFQRTTLRYIAEDKTVGTDIPLA
jgi:hypothetical protein